MFASRGLTGSEKNYQNLERECLTTIWGMEKFHYFLYGKEFTLETDHKPLVSIYKKHMEEISPRIQGLVVRSFPYQPFNMRYRKGVEIPLADALSRVTPLPMDEDGIQLPIIAVNQVTSNIPYSSNELDQICEETRKDPTLKLLMHYILIGWPCDQRQLHKSSTHSGTIRKINLLRMDLQPRVSDFSSLPPFEEKPWNKSMKDIKVWRSAC